MAYGSTDFVLSGILCHFLFFILEFKTYLCKNFYDMEELLRDLVATCERHGMNVLIDSGILELHGGELLFRCIDLNAMTKDDWRMLVFSERLDALRHYGV